MLPFAKPLSARFFCVKKFSSWTKQNKNLQLLTTPPTTNEAEVAWKWRKVRTSLGRMNPQTTEFGPGFLEKR